MRGGTRRSGALLASPVFALAIGLLILNDHVLKATWPGPVTGKLSDVAGVATVAIVAIALLRRATVAVALVASAFTALKTVPVVAVWAAPLLGGVTLTDPSDLLALAVLPPIWIWARSGGDASGDDPDWMLPVRFALIGAAVFATTATSCAGEGVLSLGVVGELIYAETSGTVFLSDDGGADWFDTGLNSWDSEFEDVDVSGAGRCGTTGVCLEIDRSSDTVPSVWSVQEVSPDGSETLLTLSDDQLRSVDDLIGRTCEGITPNDAAAVDLPDGRHVVVAMGEAGVLRQLPSGSWEWVAVGEYGFTDAGGEATGLLDFDVASTPELSFWERNAWIGTTALLLVPALMAAFVVPIRRLGHRRGREPVVATVICVIAAVGLAVLSFVMLLLTGTFDNEGARASSALVLGIVAVVIGGVLVLVELRPGAATPKPTEAPPNPNERVG